MVAALSSWHERHAAAAEALADVESLPAHVALEVYSVLTRLPGGLAVEPTLVADVLSERFARPPLRLSASERASLPLTLAQAGVSGGSSYDGLVALEAFGQDQALLTLDRRAQDVYRRLGAEFVIVG